MKFFLILFVPFMFTCSLHAVQLNEQEEITIRGTISDASTGVLLPSANILIEESYSGTISNSEGYYTLPLKDLPVTVTVRYIGYNSESRVIDVNSSHVQHFTLEPAVLEMDEIVVSERDPGLSIMERVIERKKIWRAGLDNYSSEAYTRQVLENDTSIVSISESISEAFWDREKGHREVVKSQRQTSNLDEGTNFTGVSYLPNFYDDNIEIAGFNLVGPTHPDALRYYHFSLKDYHRMDDDLIYVIDMEPRRQLQPTFRGTLYVLEREYALLEVQLKPNDVVRFPPPVREFNLSYEQQFSNYGRDYWLPVDMRINGDVRIEMIGLRFPPIKFRQVSRMSNYQVNTELPDTLFEQRQVFSVDSTTIRDTNLLEHSLDRVPLTHEEETAYATIDSTHSLEDAFRPSGFLARALMDDDENGQRGSGRVGVFLDRVLPDGLGPEFHYNRIDGFHLGLNYNRSSGQFRINGNTGYNTHAEDWDYGGEFQFGWLRSSSIHSTVLLAYSNSGVERYGSRYQKWMNSLSSVMGGKDYFDYYRSEKIRTGIRFRVPDQNLTTGIYYSQEKHNSRDLDVMDYSLFGWHESRRNNPSIQDGTLNSFMIDVDINTSSDNFGITGNRSARFQLEYSGTELNSDFEFIRLETNLNWNTQTFYQRRLMPNTLDLQFSAGISTREMPVQRSFSIDGSMSGFTPFGVLKTRRGLPYEGDRYWLFYAEHNFRTIPFELLGLRSFADRGWSLILFGGAGESGLRSNTTNSSNDYIRPSTNGIHSEAGISLNSIFGVARLDFAKRLDAPGLYIGFSVPRYF